MCGIAGIFRRRHPGDADPSRLRRMTDAILHRGPDDFGYLLLDSARGAYQLGQEGFAARPCDLLLGSRRLSIVDLSSLGRQPLANETGDVFVVHNGEIYNHIELRAVLEGKGHRFRSRTDTEVIVHAYEEWGRDCVARFNGMWAFALWDQRRRELFCSRDRFGVKPFYYHLDADLFAFASEIKGILPALEGGPSADYGVIADYLLDGSLCRTPDTFFAGIRRLEPAHCLVVSADDARTTRYWDYDTQSQAYDDRQPVEAFRGLFEDAVRLRLRSDVPVGVALSGGIDSTAILAAAAGAREGRPLQSFTSVFPGELFDEEEWARLAARHCGAELHAIAYSPDRLLDDLRDVLWHLDYPALLGQVLPRWALMRSASERVKVILEGQGADELLAGYVATYFQPFLADQWPRLRSRAALRALDGMLAACAASYRAYGAWPFAWLLAQRAAVALRLRDRVYAPGFLELRRQRPADQRPALFDDRLTQALHDDHARRTLPMLLKFGDAISMAHSLESRLPFLDYRLVEFCFRLPPQHKFDGRTSKGILRQAMAGAIPEQIQSRRDKVGFTTPISRWMRERLHTEVRPILLSDRARTRGIFDVSRLERMLSAPAPPGSGWGPQVFRWLSLELWFRMFVDGEGAPDSVSRSARARSQPAALAVSANA